MRPFAVAIVLFLLAATAAATPCTDRCYQNYQYCLSQRTPAQTCNTAYGNCTTSCSGNTNISIAFRCPRDGMGHAAYGYQGPVAVGGSARWAGSYTSPFYGAFGHPKSTLHLSWTPPDPNNPTVQSGPDNGPFHLGLGHRFELGPREHQSVAVDFTPTAVGHFAATLYVWWDYNGHYCPWETIDFFNDGVAPPPPAAGSTSGRQGGAETFPMFLFATQDALPRRSPPPLWDAEKRERSAGRGTRVSLPLRDLMPPSIAGIAPAFRQPEAAIIGGSNAIESLAGDYVDPATGAVRAVVLAFRSRNDVYAHVYSVCARVKGGWLEDMRYTPASVPGSPVGPTFWESTMSIPDGTGTLRREVATGFAAYASSDARQFTIDSRWLSESYARHPEMDGEVLTLQVWAADAETMAATRFAVLERLVQRGTVDYRNVGRFAQPDAFIAAADYGDDAATLWTMNRTSSDRVVDLTAITWTAGNSSSEQRYEFTRTIRPGRDSLRLDMPGRLNGVVYMTPRDTNSTDMVYFADGTWFSYGESGQPAWSVPECPPRVAGPSDLAAAGCAKLAPGNVPVGGWRGIGRALTTYTRASLDLHNYRAVSFWAKGSELPAQAQFVSYAADGTRLSHVAQFTPSANGRQITIPFSWFAGRDAAAGRPFTGEGVSEVTWEFAGGPFSAAELNIGNVFFTTELELEDAFLLTFAPETATPYPVAARLLGAANTPAATLAYRRRGEASFTRLPMGQIDDVFFGEIPPQPPGSVVESFIELTDADGRRSASPPDAPFATNAFVISQRPAVLIDDFETPLSRNRRGGTDATFRSPGALVTAERDGARLRLQWDVTATGSFSGWLSPFRTPVDGSTLDSLTIRVRGAAGGERVKLGLGDASGREHKVLLAKFVDGGIAADWRSIRVPLDVFTTIDRSMIAKILLVFESAVGARSGAIDVDDLLLESSGVRLPIPVDTFDDGTLETALGGNVFTATGGGATMTASHDPLARAGAEGSGLRVLAAGPAASYATLGFDLRGLDARTLGRVQLWMRGTRGGERLNAYLISGTGASEVRRRVELPALTTAYQLVSVPLASFAGQGVDLQHLARFELVWEGAGFSDAVDLDDVEFAP